MNVEQTFARSAVEALRSGVPSRHAVAQLGTTQEHVREEFEDRVQAMAEGGVVAPMMLAANFGAGKSHLLNYLRALAAERGCVTSLVVVSPEMPLGNPHLVLKSIAEAAEAPGRIGRALQAMMDGFQTSASAWSELRAWAREAGLDDRFPAMLTLYEELRADEELRRRILEDFEGTSLNVSTLRQQLKEVGQSASYVLKAKKNVLLAHDRIRLLARLFRAAGARGWVVLFDELERVHTFSRNQRLAVWEELGWWQHAAQQEGAAFLPVFTVVTGDLDRVLSDDEPRFRSASPGLDPESRDLLGQAGIGMARNPIRLTSPDREQIEVIKYRTQAIYERAYGLRPPEVNVSPGDEMTPIRVLIRQWITRWDLARYDPNYSPTLVSDDVTFDEMPPPDDLAFEDDDSEAMS